MPRREKLPPEWWNKVLDGRPYEVDLADIPTFGSLSSFRAATYRQADLRGLSVSTRKVDVHVLLVQATWTQGPEITVDFLGRGQGLTPPRVELEPVVRSARGRGVAPFVHANAPAPLTRIVEDDDELLGPCSCGLSPQCLPTCTRVLGSAPGPTAAGSGPGQDPDSMTLGLALGPGPDLRSFFEDPPPGPDA